MPKHPQIAVVVRDIQKGAGRTETFDHDAFMKKADRVVKLLTETPAISQIYIVSCRDQKQKCGEATNDHGDTLTWQSWQQAYPDLITVGSIIYVPVDDWGPNLGSGRAVQAGVDAALATGFDHIMVWSTKLRLEPHHVTKALAALVREKLAVVGFLRENFNRHPCWLLPQHTGMIGTRAYWEAARIPHYVDGDEGLTIETEAGPAPLAGMDDMALAFEVLKRQPDLRVGMYLGLVSIPYTGDLKDPEREQEKQARQSSVVLEWARRAFPDQQPEKVLERFLDSLVTVA